MSTQTLLRTVLEAVQKVQVRIEELRRSKGDRKQLEFKFGDRFDLPLTATAAT